MLTVICMCSCKGHLKTKENGTAPDEKNTALLSETVKTWADAYYSNKPDEYIERSFKNKECMRLLGSVDYDYDAIFESAVRELNDYAEFMNEKYSFYYVQTRPSEYEIYEKGSDTYQDYLSQLKDMYPNADVIDAFALVEFYINIDYTQDSSMMSDEETSKVECMLINDNWYVID